jgi:hypothetical protein
MAAHAFDLVKLNNAANGKTESEGGLNIPELAQALLAVNESLLLPDINPPVTSLLGGQMRDKLKALLKILPQDLDKTLPVAAQLPSIDAEQFAIFGVGNLIHSDQMWLADNMSEAGRHAGTQAMMIHCSTLKPLTNCLLGWSATLEEIESVFDPVEFSIAGNSEMAVNIGVTSGERDKLAFSVGDLHVQNFSRFFASYAPTGCATCYITDEKIPKGALQISFATLAGTLVIVKHGLAGAMLAALSAEQDGANCIDWLCTASR